MTFGQFLAAARKSAGLSQKDLAARVLKEDRVSVSAQYINDLERDRRNPPSDHILQQLARVLAVSYDQLSVVAGQFPADLRERLPQAEPERLELAMQAFRRVIDAK